MLIQMGYMNYGLIQKLQKIHEQVKTSRDILSEKKNKLYKIAENFSESHNIKALESAAKEVEQAEKDLNNAKIKSLLAKHPDEEVARELANVLINTNEYSGSHVLFVDDGNYERATLGYHNQEKENQWLLISFKVLSDGNVVLCGEFVENCEFIKEQ